MKKVIAYLFFASSLFVAKGQNGDISGKITDQNGEGIRFATVTLVDSQGVKTGKGIKTDADGNYSIHPLGSGKYSVQASFKGYLPEIMEGVLVSSDKTTFIDIRLKPVLKGAK